MPSRTAPEQREPGTTELYIAPEVEYPTTRDSPTPTFTRGGVGARGWRDFAINNGRQPVDGEAIIGTDGTVGIEIRPDTNYGLQTDRVKGWYRHLLEDGEDAGYPHEPVGIMTDDHSTAGLHLHLSPLTQEQAETLYEWSQEDWMQAFVCTSIISEGSSSAHTAQVFRNNYCRFDSFDNGRYSAVHSANGPGHYEWRLPEPMTADHFALVVEFLSIFYNDGPDEARAFAMSLLDSRDTRLTGVRRMDASDIPDRLGDPDHTVHRTPWRSTVDFYDSIREDSSMPYIYQVYNHSDEQAYYTFRSHQNDDSNSWSVPGHDFRITSGLVIDADTLDTVSPSEAQRVNDALSQRTSISAADIRTTDATSLLLP